MFVKSCSLFSAKQEQEQVEKQENKNKNRNEQEQEGKQQNKNKNRNENKNKNKRTRTKTRTRIMLAVILSPEQQSTCSFSQLAGRFPPKILQTVAHKWSSFGMLLASG